MLAELGYPHTRAQAARLVLGVAPVLSLLGACLGYLGAATGQAIAVARARRRPG